MEIEIVQEPAQRTAYVRGSLASPGEAWHELMAVEGVNELFGRPGVYSVSAFSSDVVRGTVPHEQAPYDAALVLPEGVGAPAGLTEGGIPAGRYARATHLGPYEGLSEAWGEFSKALGEQSLEVADGTCFEAYRNAPGSVPDAELRTDLYIPVA